MADGTAHLTMGELLELRDQMGSKEFSEKVTKPKFGRLRNPETPTVTTQNRVYGVTFKISNFEEKSV